MALKTFVKISEVNNLSDARYCAGMMVDAIGFPVDPAMANYLKPEEYTEITEWISGIAKVVEFESNDLQLIQQMTVEHQVDYIQVMHIDLLEALQSTGKKLIYKVDLAQKSMDEVEDEISDIESYIEFVLIEDSRAVSMKEDLEAVYELSKEYDIVLGFEVNQQSLPKLLNSEIKGIAIKGGEEIRPGFKNYDEFEEILEALDEE
ncbi:phosphoribosylanthranilate isomerase [Persicobacter psychrovividus]|uniref:Phosphoribosylanthranilate isomerase n=1 Tax=Persicobacter psychrovividus TaxID=387638 RepID=A0ABM7VDT7_9BACT|nr:hypothetical protein PEPS_14080 [Persicobacter psychrovividus]